MNSVQLVGRFVRDPDIRYSDGGHTIARFTLAVDRPYKKEGGQEADFIACLAFGKTAEFLEKYFRKGQRIGLTGRIQTGSYTNKEGIKVYTTDVVTDRVEFVESRGASGGDGYQESGRTAVDYGDGGFMNIPDEINEEIPF